MSKIVYKQTKEHKDKTTKAKIGIPRSEETKNKIREKRKLQVMKPVSEETRKKISDKAKKRGPFTKEHIKNLSESHKGKSHPMPDSSKQKIRDWNIAHPNRKFKDTGIELKIEEELIKRGINYVKQVPLCKVTISDFFLPDYNIAIFADGCYWHSCPLCKRGNMKDHIESDLSKTNVLISNGFNVYRFWEHEINESVEKCIDRLMV